LAAAKRMAARKGMSLEDAAAAQPPEPHVVPENPRPTAQDEVRAKEFARYADLMEYQLRMEKVNRENAFKAARARGLDQEEERAARQRKKRAANFTRSRSNARMEPFKHAEMLLRETSFPFHEVATITGLDLYEVVAVKLKMRKIA
jgi:hypothetical protein